MARIGDHVKIVAPGDLKDCTGVILNRKGGDYKIRLDYEMEDDRTGEIVRVVEVGAMWVAELAEREVGR